MKKHGTLSEVMNRLKIEEGYIEDFNLLDDHLELKSEKKRFKADDFVVDEVYRFEGMSNPSDNSVLYAISTATGKKGVLIDAYGAYSGQISEEMIKKLNAKAHRPIN